MTARIVTGLALPRDEIARVVAADVAAGSHVNLGIGFPGLPEVSLRAKPR